MSSTDPRVLTEKPRLGRRLWMGERRGDGETQAQAWRRLFGRDLAAERATFARYEDPPWFAEVAPDGAVAVYDEEGDEIWDGRPLAVGPVLWRGASPTAREDAWRRLFGTWLFESSRVGEDGTGAEFLYLMPCGRVAARDAAGAYAIYDRAAPPAESAAEFTARVLQLALDALDSLRAKHDAGMLGIDRVLNDLRVTALHAHAGGLGDAEAARMIAWALLVAEKQR